MQEYRIQEKNLSDTGFDDEFLDRTEKAYSTGKNMRWIY